MEVTQLETINTTYHCPRRESLIKRLSKKVAAFVDNRMAYHKIKRSLKDVEKGRVYKLNSLRDLR